MAKVVTSLQTSQQVVHKETYGVTCSVNRQWEEYGAPYRAVAGEDNLSIASLRLYTPDKETFLDGALRMEARYYILATSSLADDRNRILKQGETFAVFDR
jgi:hypothetical protein